MHALGQVAHVDLGRDWAPERLAGALNFHLRPAPIAVLEAREVAPDFHARFSSTGRRYLYRILTRRGPPALERGRVWHLPVPLDAERMHVAAQALVGRHDFTSFRASECQSASPVKTLRRHPCRAARRADRVRLSARSFLHHQVRNIVGTLKLVGEGKAPIGLLREVLEARDAPPRGRRRRPRGCSCRGGVRVQCHGESPHQQPMTDLDRHRPEFTRALRVLAEAFEIARGEGAAPPVIVGGAAVEDHTVSAVQSADIYLVTAEDDILAAALEAVGFRRSTPGSLRNLIYPDLLIGVDFVSGRLFDGRTDRARIELVRLDEFGARRSSSRRRRT